VEKNSSSLFIVPTPIGNLGDITLRALEVLEEVDLILAEDTRKTGILLKHYNINKPLKSNHNFNEHKQLETIISDLKSGTRIALVSDAGTPGISDPGYLLIRQCLRNEIEIEVLPGPTAFVPALLKSGFPCDRFNFEGFLPHKKGRKTRIDEISNENRTSILYESPHRLLKTLTQLMEVCGTDREVSVSRELTKIHEETRTGSIQEVLEYFSNKPLKGEFVIVLQGKE